MWPASVRSVRGVLIDGIRTEMILMPLIENPFQRIAMDTVGPLLRSQAGNKYILAICNYATHYPCSKEAERIDKELVFGFGFVNMWA